MGIDATEWGSMTRSRRPASVPPGRRAGLALPTVLAAVVCGGAVLAIAVTGAIALDAEGPVLYEGRQPWAIRMPAAFAPPAALPQPDVSAAVTAPDHSIAVHGGGFDSEQVPPADRGPLGTPRTIAAAAPTVVVLDPTTQPAP